MCRELIYIEACHLPSCRVAGVREVGWDALTSTLKLRPSALPRSAQTSWDRRFQHLTVPGAALVSGQKASPSELRMGRGPTSGLLEVTHNDPGVCPGGLGPQPSRRARGLVTWLSAAPVLPDRLSRHPSSSGGISGTLL